MTTEMTVRPNGSEIVRQEFGVVQSQQQLETASAAVAARERAAVEARYIVALQRPRNVEQFRVRLEQDCKRPGFALKAEYAKPIGKKWNARTQENEDQYAYGPSIRFIEAALQHYGNVYPEVVTVYDSQAMRICRVSVTDLEANITYSTEVQITKVVERKGKNTARKNQPPQWEPPAGRILVGEGRPNSYGDMTYPVVATDDEVLIKQNALLSKALRTNAQRLLPWDIVERCMEIARQTRATEDAQDPEAAKRRVVDAFASIGVEPVDLEAWLGHALNKPLVPAEREQLLKIHAAIKDGETTWDDVMSEKSETGSREQQEEMLKQKLAAVEAEKQRQQQQDNPPQQTNNGSEEKAGDVRPGETEQIATASGTSSEIPPTPGPGLSAQEQVLGRPQMPPTGRNRRMFGGDGQ